MTRIRIENITKKYDDKPVVDDVSLDIQDKELLIFLGPSGCGKSTTLNIIAGLDEQDGGRVYFDDEDVTDVPPHRRNIAMVFQTFAIYPHLNVKDNIAMGLKTKKLPKEEVEKRVLEAAKILKIDGFLKRKPHQLSGGERQRVATARALIKEPSVFLMDEPLSNLDAAMREEMRAEIMRIQKSIGETMIFVTHDQVEAMTMGDRIVVMENGKIMQIGTPDDIYNFPANNFVAGFVGAPPMNFFEGHLARENGGLSIRCNNPEFTRQIPDEVVENVDTSATDKDVIMGIRPEGILVTKEETDVSASIYAVEPLGNQVIVSFTFTDSGDKIFKPVMPPGFRADIDETVWIDLKMDKIYLFDKNTEESIVIRST